MKKIVVVLLAVATVAVACTPEEIHLWEQIHGVDVPADVERDLIDPPASTSGCPVPELDAEGGCIPEPIDWDSHYQGQGLHCGRWASEALEAGWTHDQIPKVLRTMRRESMCIPHARSGSRDTGLMQINDIILRDMAQRPHLWGYALTYTGRIPTIEDLKNPMVNLMVARNLWLIDGWSPWRGGA